GARDGDIQRPRDASRQLAATFVGTHAFDLAGKSDRRTRQGRDGSSRRKESCAEPRKGLESLAIYQHSTRRSADDRRYRGRRRNPANLDDAYWGVALEHP